MNAEQRALYREAREAARWYLLAEPNCMSQRLLMYALETHAWKDKTFIARVCEWAANKRANPLTRRERGLIIAVEAAVLKVYNTHARARRRRLIDEVTWWVSDET